MSDLGAGPSHLDKCADQQQPQQCKRRRRSTRSSNNDVDTHIITSTNKKGLKQSFQQIYEKEMIETILKKNPVHASEKQAVINTFKQLKESNFSKSKTKLIDKAAEVSGISCATVYNIIKEYNTKGCIQSPVHRKPKRKICDDLDDLSLGAPTGPSHLDKCADQQQQRKSRCSSNNDADTDILTSTKKKRLKQNPLQASEKQAVLNTFEQLKESNFSKSKTKLMDKTAEVSGISRATVYNILKEYKTKGCIQSPVHRKPKPKICDKLDDLTLGALRRKVNQLYFNGELPTLDKIVAAVNEDESLPQFSRTSLYRILKEVLKFEYLKRSKKSII